PWRWRSFLMLSLATFWLRRPLSLPLSCSRRRSTTLLLLLLLLSVLALHSFSLATRFTGRCPTRWRRDWLTEFRRWPAGARPSFRCTTRLRTKLFSLRSSSATLRRNLSTTLVGSWTFAQFSCWRATLFRVRGGAFEMRRRCRPR